MKDQTHRERSQEQHSVKIYHDNGMQGHESKDNDDNDQLPEIDVLGREEITTNKQVILNSSIGRRDDCRYFGTLNLITEYESAITEHCKCTMEGVSKEFVSIQLNHNITDRTFELTQEDYWVKAVERFKEHLNDKGPKTRLIPLSPADEKLLVEPTEAEIKKAENLPYSNLLGVVQYPSNYTKLEMKYAMSVLSRYRTKWGINHFKILIKSLEYGCTTRKMGLKFNGNMEPKNRNRLVANADSSFTLPRSQGCRLIMMNGDAILLIPHKREKQMRRTL
jgi:hypothetical protein